MVRDEFKIDEAKDRALLEYYKYLKLGQRFK